MITILITIIIVIIEKNRNETRIKGLYFNDFCLLFVLGGIDYMLDIFRVIQDL